MRDGVRELEEGGAAPLAYDPIGGFEVGSTGEGAEVAEIVR